MNCTDKTKQEIYLQACLRHQVHLSVYVYVHIRMFTYLCICAAVFVHQSFSPWHKHAGILTCLSTYLSPCLPLVWLHSYPYLLPTHPPT